jgi:hypothetical protein
MRTIARGFFASALALVALAVLPAGVANAQPVGVVQLPTFQFFSVQTTVSVPDSGGAYLGGARRSSTYHSQRGLPLVGRDPLFGGRAIGRTSSASGVSVHAQIHDMQEMDEAVLRQAGGRRPASPRAVAARVRNEPSKSVAQIRRDQDAAVRSTTDDADHYLAKSRQALAEGKTGVARVNLQMALRRAQGEKRNEVLAALATLQPPTIAAQRRSAVIPPE